MPSDPGRALTLYHRGALAGNAWATFKVGALLAEGRGVIADPSAAAAWLQAAHEQGVDQAGPTLARLGAGTLGPTWEGEGTSPAGTQVRVPFETMASTTAAR